MTFQVTLTDAEISTIKLFGNLRTIVNRCSNIVNPAYGPKRTTADPMDIDEQGLFAEYAFCKHWNIFLDLTPTIRSGGFDCILGGKRFDIKSTHYKNGQLIKPVKENNEVDCYALAIVDGNTITFPGWAFHIELCQEKNIKTLKHLPSYAMEQSELRQWKNK